MTKPLPTMVDANGTSLYYELRGSGPALLFIPGAEGDAGEYARVVGLLQDKFTILSYDRRGYSRSPRPEGFVGTTVEQQADDAAALLEATGLAPATIWGNPSGGAAFSKRTVSVPAASAPRPTASGRTSSRYERVRSR